jgi:hypothetical protein
MSLINSCSVHYGVVQWSGGEPSKLFDPLRAAVKRIYRPLMTIFIRLDEVAYVAGLISRRGSNSASFPSARFPLESAIACRS